MSRVQYIVLIGSYVMYAYSSWLYYVSCCNVTKSGSPLDAIVITAVTLCLLCAIISYVRYLFRRYDPHKCLSTPCSTGRRTRQRGRRVVWRRINSSGHRRCACVRCVRTAHTTRAMYRRGKNSDDSGGGDRQQ